MSNILIKTVETKSDLKKFMMLPWDIYQNDPIWVAPLISSYKKVFDKNKNPFFLHGDMTLFYAEKDGKVLGRIASIQNHLHNTTWNDKVGFFGFFECIDNQEVANMLLDTARKDLESKGYEQMRGPASPSSNEDYGVLSDGFDEQHVILSTYNARWYLDLYENYGMKRVRELYAFKFDGPKVWNQNREKIERLYQAILERTGVVFEDLDMKKFAEGVKTFKGLFNKAWSAYEHHGWVPLTDEEFDFITGDLKAITDPRLVMLARVNGEVIGGVICLPDYNEIFRKWKGKLFPFNFIDMFTKAKKIKCLRIVILGVIPEYQKKGIDAIMYYEIIKRGLERGMTWAEASYIVEGNDPMKRPLLNIGGEIYKTYQVMEIPVARQ